MNLFAPAAKEIVLRGYQEDAVEKLRNGIRQGCRRQILVAPTAFGKTECAAHIIQQSQQKGATAWFIVDRVSLIDQTSERFAQYGIDHGVIQADHWLTNTKKPVQIASAQTLARRKIDWTPNLIVVDEAHCQYKSTIDLINRAANAKVIGLTATPFTAGMAENWDGLINGATVNKLLADKYLTPLKIKACVAPDMAGAKKKFTGEYEDEESASRGITIIGDVVQTWVEQTRKHFGGPAKTIVFSPSVRHGAELCCQFAEAGFNFQQISYLDGDDDDRRAKIAEFRKPNSAIDGLVSCAVLTKGFDCFDSETEILTPDGWKGIGQFAEGDAVYGFNRETERVEVVEVDGYGERPLDPGERMVAIKSQRFDIRTTEGHQFHIKYRDPKMGGRRSKNFITKTAMEMVDRKSAYLLPISGEMEFPGAPLTDDELRLIAWFMTDGGFSTRTFQIVQSKEFKHEIRELLTRIGIDFREYQADISGYPNGRTATKFDIPKGTHTGTLARNGWSKYAQYLDKNVSPSLMSMTRQQFRVFWAELLKGDGAKQGNKAGWLWCDRKEQADAYTHMAVVRGFSASFSTQMTKAGKPMYVVSVRDAQWLQTEPKSDLAAKFVVDEAAPGERVWCIKNRLSTVITRRRGKIAIVGNCPDVLCGISCRPYRKSFSSHIQEMGRVMRIAPGKEYGLWLDHSGNCISFANDTAWLFEYGVDNLSDAAKRDSEVREPKEQTRKERFCGDCGMQMEPGCFTCQSCGWERPQRGEIQIVQGELIDLEISTKEAFQPRHGLRADCLKNPRSIWNAALAFTMSNSRNGEERARKWAYGIWAGIYPGAKLPYGLFDAPCIFDKVQPDEFSLIDREVRRFRKSTRKAAA